MSTEIIPHNNRDEVARHGIFVPKIVANADGRTQYHLVEYLTAHIRNANTRADGRFPKIFRRLSKTHVLVLDHWGLDPLTAPQRRDLLELLDDRHGRRSTIATSQFPVDTWHKTIGDSKTSQYLY